MKRRDIVTAVGAVVLAGRAAPDAGVFEFPFYSGFCQGWRGGLRRVREGMERVLDVKRGRREDSLLGLEVFCRLYKKGLTPPID